MKITNNSSLIGFNPMMALIENGVLAEKSSNFNTISNTVGGNEFSGGLNDYQSPSIQTNTNSLFSNLEEIGSQSNKFINYSSNLMMSSGKDQNNNFFQFEQIDSNNNTNTSNNNNSNFLDYNYFTRFNSLMEMNANSGKVILFLFFFSLLRKVTFVTSLISNIRL